LAVTKTLAYFRQPSVRKKKEDFKMIKTGGYDGSSILKSTELFNWQTGAICNFGKKPVASLFAKFYNRK
jgi:hypothetical protein